MEPGNEVARSPAFICKGFLLTVSMFAGFFGVFFSIWKRMHNAVPSFLFLEITCILLLRLYVRYMKGTLFTEFTRKRLKVILVIACIFSVATFAYAIFLLVTAIRNSEGFTIHDNGSYFALVPCVIAHMWSGLLIFETRTFIGMSDGASLPYRLH